MTRNEQERGVDDEPHASAGFRPESLARFRDGFVEGIVGHKAFGDRRLIVGVNIAAERK